MKNRTLTGIICILLATVSAFVLIPFLNKTSAKEIKVIRIKQPVHTGSIITEEALETVTVQLSSLPEGVITDSSEIIGKYALCDLFIGDYLITEKITNKNTSTSFVLLNLAPGEMAVTVEITSFADGFSGQLSNGDVVSLFVFDKSSKTVTQLPELQYVSVITTVNGSGNSKDSATTEDDSLPKTLMLKVNSEQAALLFGYSNSASVCCAFVCHADSHDAEKYLDRQNEYFLNKKLPTSNPPETNTHGEHSAAEPDIIENANRIISDTNMNIGD